MFLKGIIFYATSHFIKRCQAFSHQRGTRTQSKNSEGKQQHKPAFKKTKKHVTHLHTQKWFSVELNEFITVGGNRA